VVQREPSGELTANPTGERGARRLSLGRDARVVISAMVALSAIAWVYLFWMPVGGMTRGILARKPDAMGMGDTMSMPMPMTSKGQLMDVSGWAASLPLFVVMWLVMMVAMMFPAASPGVLIFDRWRRSRQRPAAATVAFVAGYLITWTVAGVFVFAAIVVLDTQLAGMSAAVRVGGAILIVAGVYQFTPLKAACLAECRSPLSLIMQHAQRLGRGIRGPLQVGLWHGGYCLGCCWALMAVLVALGVMHLGWMAAVSVLILAEKVLPGGRVTASVIGAGLIAAGGLVVATGVGVMA
jgi:predicted metal-binding membrane protein